MRMMIIPYEPPSERDGESLESVRTATDPLLKDGTIGSVMTLAKMSYIVGYSARRNEYYLLKNRLPHPQRGRMTPAQFREFLRQVELNEIQYCEIDQTVE